MLNIDKKSATTKLCIPLFTIYDLQHFWCHSYHKTQASNTFSIPHFYDLQLFRMTLISKFKMSILQRWCTFWLEQWVFENLWQESHFTLHNSQSVIYTDSTKPNPNPHSAFLILMTCNFSADATGPTFQDETDENDGWVPNTGFSSIGHLPKRPKCALINQNHIAPGIYLFSELYIFQVSWHQKKLYPTMAGEGKLVSWNQEMMVQPLTSTKEPPGRFICSLTHTLCRYQSSFLMVFSFALSHLHR